MLSVWTCPEGVNPPKQSRGRRQEQLEETPGADGRKPFNFLTCRLDLPTAPGSAFSQQDIPLLALPDQLGAQRASLR